MSDCPEEAYSEACEEIERLKEIVQSLSDHNVAAERMALLKAQQAEIDRLTLEHGKMCDSRREWMEKAIAAGQENERLKMSDVPDEAYSEALAEIRELKTLIKANVAIIESGTPVTVQFLDELRKAAE